MSPAFYFMFFSECVLPLEFSRASKMILATCLQIVHMELASVSSDFEKMMR
jgi:hypothetical protein